MESMTFKAELILEASKDIVKYIDKKHAIDVDMYDIAGLINYTLGSFIKPYKNWGVDDE